MKVNQTERWFRLILGALALFFAGVIYAWSILSAPFARAVADGGFGWDAKILGLNYTIAISSFCIGGFVSGLLSKKLAPRVRMVISAILLFAGFFITSRLNPGVSPVALYLAYGVVAGVGIGFVYNTVIGLTNAWFPDRKGLCSGVLMMAFGFSSLVLGKIADKLIGMESVGWRTTFLILAAAAGAALLLTAVFIKAPAPGTEFPKPKSVSGKKASAPAAARDYTAVEMIKTLAFWQSFVYVLLMAAAGSAAISFAKGIIADVDPEAPASFAVTVAGILSVFNGLGRLVSGALIDRLGVRRTQYVTNTIAVAAPLIVVLSLSWGSLPLGVAGLCLCGFSYGCAPTASAAYSAAFFGQKNFSLNFSIMNLILIPASFAATVAGNLKASTGSFTSTFIILAALCAVNYIVGLSIKKA